MNESKQNLFAKYYWLFFTILLGILCLLCFYNLGEYNLNWGDETRYGASAIEMIKNNNYLINYYGGEIDYCNLKPPFSYWIIILGYKIFGYNAWGLRFFSALSYVILAVIITLFVKKKANKTASLIALLLFSTLSTFFTSHFIRTGDADSIYILFIGIALISLSLASDNPNWLHLTGLMFALAFLTKATHVIILCPIIFFYWLFTKMYKQIKWWQYITTILCAIIPILIWGIARFQFDGFKFIWEMLFHDFLERTTQPIDYQTGTPFYYYLVELSKKPTLMICLILFIITLICKLIKKEKFSNLDILCLISILTIFILFSCAQTKYFWYWYPACVPLIIAGSISVTQVYDNLFKHRILQTIFYISLAITAFYCLTQTVQIIDEYKYWYSSKVSFNNTSNNIKKENHITMFFEYDDFNLNKQDLLWPESDTLCVLEWQLDAAITIKWGGYDAFLQNKDSYLLMDKDDFEAKDAPDYIRVINSSDDYVFCYNCGE